MVKISSTAEFQLRPGVKISRLTEFRSSVDGAFFPVNGENPCGGPATYPRTGAAIARRPRGDLADSKAAPGGPALK